MSTMDWVLSALGIVALFVGAYLVIRSTTVKSNLKEQAALIETLMKGKTLSNEAIKSLEDRAGESDKKVANLSGQVDVLKNIPLKEIAAAQIATAAEMKTLSTTQRAILELLSNNSTKGGGTT